MIPSLLMRGVRQLCNGSAHCTGPARSYTCDRLSDSWLCGERRCEFPPTLHASTTYTQGASLWGLQQYSSIIHTLLLAFGQAL